MATKLNVFTNDGSMAGCCTVPAYQALKGKSVLSDWREAGYVAVDRADGRRVFIPWHAITHVVEVESK